MKPLTMTFKFQEYEVTGEYMPSTPDVWYLSNGDPGYPGDPSEFEVKSVTKNGVSIPLEVFFPNAEEDELMYDQMYDELCLTADEEYGRLQGELYKQMSEDEREYF